MENEVSYQYAKALFELTTSKEDKMTDLANLKVLSEVLLKEDVMKVFKHPTITKDAKKELIEQVLKGKVAPSFLYFVFVLIDNQRLEDLSAICESYESLLDNYLGQVRVLAKSKYPLNDEIRNEIKKYLKKYYQKEIILKEMIDENQPHGLLISSGNEIIDLTLATKLNQLVNNLKG